MVLAGGRIPEASLLLTPSRGEPARGAKRNGGYDRASMLQGPPDRRPIGGIPELGDPVAATGKGDPGYIGAQRRGVNPPIGLSSRGLRVERRAALQGPQLYATLARFARIVRPSVVWSSDGVTSSPRASHSIPRTISPDSQEAKPCVKRTLAEFNWAARRCSASGPVVRLFGVPDSYRCNRRGVKPPPGRSFRTQTRPLRRLPASARLSEIHRPGAIRERLPPRRNGLISQPIFEILSQIACRGVTVVRLSRQSFQADGL